MGGLLRRPPVLVDVGGDGFALTAAPSGVLFDIRGTSVNRWAWDVFLVTEP